MAPAGAGSVMTGPSAADLSWTGWPLAGSPGPGSPARVPLSGDLPGPAVAGRLRTDSRVTASRKATPRAARPASWASTTGVPIGRAWVLATGLARAPLVFWPGLGFGTADGLMVG